MGTLTTIINKIKGVEVRNTTKTVWQEKEHISNFSRLKNNISTDIAIVGGGIAGISTAYLLSKEGKKVVVIDSGKIGQGETVHTTAQIVNTLERGYGCIIDAHNKEISKLVAESHNFAIDTIESIIKDNKIDCDFKRIDGYLFAENNSHDLKKEYRACLDSGLNLEYLETVPGIDTERAEAIQFKNQARFHPLKYMNALCKLIIKNGGEIYTDSSVTEINSKGVLVNDSLKVNAAHIVIATNNPINLPKIQQLKPKVFRSYVIAAKIPKNSLPDLMWWELNDLGLNKKSGHYVRIDKNYDKDHDLLICGGEDHSQQNEENYIVDHFKLLRNWAKDHFPMMGEIVYRWSGKLLESEDLLALIGRNPFDSGNIYIVTCNAGNGMTYGTIAGLLLRDLVKGRKNPWEEIYDPSRVIYHNKDVIEKVLHYNQVN